MTRLLIANFLLLPALLRGQSSTCEKPFEAAMPSASRISMDIRSGDTEIVGSSRAVIRVTCRITKSGAAGDVRISLAANHLRIYGGPNNVHFRVEVPERSSLLVRVPAGDMNISGVTGDKDIQLRAGDLTMEVGAPGQYRVAEGSVTAGDLRAPAFGVNKDGLMRSFRKENATGQYRLHVELTAGDLTLK